MPNEIDFVALVFFWLNVLSSFWLRLRFSTFSVLEPFPSARIHIRVNPRPSAGRKYMVAALLL